jgi:zinc transport system substrate-binding protein
MKTWGASSQEERSCYEQGALPPLVRAPALAFALASASVLAGCAQPAAGDGRPEVMASFYPIEFLARSIGEPNVTVGVLVPPGVEPHDYEPTPGDVAKVAGAKVVLMQGAGFESWIDGVRDDAPQARFAAVTEGIDLRDEDPHAWLDPTLFAKMAENVETTLAQAFPEHAAAFRARAQALAADLARLDADFTAGLADCDVRVVVTNHAAFGYMAARYDFTMIPISGLDPEAEPTPETLQAVIEEVRRHNVTVVFFEDLVSPKVAQTVAREANATTRVLSPVEGILPDEAARGATYVTKMRDDLAALREGMRCK